MTEKGVELTTSISLIIFSERDIRHCLHDKDLACWSELDQPCHADLVLRIVKLTAEVAPQKEEVAKVTSDR